MFEGCLVALVAPFKNGEIDYEKLRELVDWQLEQGTNGIVPCGTTGESPTLSHEEHQEVIKAVIERVAGRVPVVAGTGSNNTAEALRLTQFAAKIGADAALMITPYYNKPEPEGMYEHFKTVAEAVDIPIILYNVPGRTGRSITPETVARLAEIPNVVGIKEASLSVDQAVDILRRCDITMLSGEDSMTLPLMAVGAKGVISVVANIIPKDMIAMIQAFNAGDMERAMAMNQKMFPLCKAVFIETNPIPIKTAMKLMDMMNGELRLPLSPMTAAHEAQLSKVLADYGLLNKS